MTKPTPADWLRLAADDVVVAQEAHKKGIYHLACFHAQQAAEKLLKAYLVFRDQPIPKIHALRELYKLDIPLLPTLSEHLEAIETLDQYYIPTRYPDALPGFLPEGPPTEVHSRQALADVEKLADLVKKEVDS